MWGALLGEAPVLDQLRSLAERVAVGLARGACLAGGAADTASLIWALMYMVRVRARV